jgi:hypothetical protein
MEGALDKHAFDKHAFNGMQSTKRDTFLSGCQMGEASIAAGQLHSPEIDMVSIRFWMRLLHLCMAGKCTVQCG